MMFDTMSQWETTSLLVLLLTRVRMHTCDSSNSTLGGSDLIVLVMECCYCILKVCFIIFSDEYFFAVSMPTLFSEPSKGLKPPWSIICLWYECGWFASILLLICSFIAYTSVCFELYTFLFTHSSCYFRLEGTISVSTGLVHHGRN